MKKLFTVLLFGLFLGLAAPGFTQNGNGNGNGQQHTVLPTQTVVKILKLAKEEFASRFGIHMSLGLWMQKYNNCECTIIEVQPKYFRVEFGGGTSILVLDTL